MRSVIVRTLSRRGKYRRVDADILRPSIVGRCQTTFGGRLEGATVRILRNIASLIINHGLDEVSELGINRKKGAVMSKLRGKKLRTMSLQVLETEEPDCQYHATTAHFKGRLA